MPCGTIDLGAAWVPVSRACCDFFAETLDLRVTFAQLLPSPRTSVFQLFLLVAWFALASLLRHFRITSASAMSHQKEEI